MAALIVPDIVPSPTEDCESLRKAVQGTDKKAIIRILGHRNATQRRLIKDTYQQLYEESLIDRLRSKLSGDFGKAVILWAYEPWERDAKLANDALKARRVGLKQLQVIVEIACASSPHHLQAVREAYCSLFDCSLEEAIASAVSLPLRKLLVGLVRSFRYDKELVDANIAIKEAKKLHKAIKRKQLDDDDIVFVLSTRNVYQLRATFQCYQLKFGIPIDQDIRSFGKGDLESLLRVVTLCIESPEKYFAEVMGAAIIGLGTDEDSLSRAIVTRAEIDTVKIRTEYLNMFKTTLDDAVIGDTSGDYKDFLMTLLGAGI